MLKNKRVVSVILERKISKKTVNTILYLSKKIECENYFLSLIDSKIIDHICSETGRKRKKVEEEQVIKRYEELYEIEEIFKSENTNINFDVKIFNGYEEMEYILNLYEPGLLIFCEPDTRELEEIIKIKSDLPFLILKN